MSEQAAPGWYPVDERTERWWDGQQWSEHQRAQEQAPPPTGVPAAPYPYGGDAIQRPQAPMQSQGYDPTPTYSQPDGQGPPDPFGRQPQYFGQQPPYGRAPGYAEPAPTRSAGRTIAAVLVALLGVLFTLCRPEQHCIQLRRRGARDRLCHRQPAHPGGAVDGLLLPRPAPQGVTAQPRGAAASAIG